MTKTRMGRPPKSGDKPMAGRLEIRLLPGEKEAYEQAATLQGEQMSDWIRATLNRAAERALKQKRPG
jgi:uncharacterized protein (DUF1778 family)